MPKAFVKRLAFFILALIAILALFKYNVYAGLTVTAVIIPITAFLSRAVIFVLLGNRHYVSGDTNKALRFYEKAFKTGKCKPNVLISYSYLLLRSGETDEPEKILNSVINSNPGIDTVMNAKSNLALVSWKKGNIDEAVAILEKIFENYKNTTIYGNLGYMLILKGDLDKALAFNLEAYEYNNRNNVIQDNLGQTYYLMGKFDESEEVYNSLMTSNPNTPGINFNYGLLMAALGHTERALEYMRKALSLKINPLSGVTEEEIRYRIDHIEKGLAN